MDEKFPDRPDSLSDLADRVRALSADKRALLEIRLKKRGSGVAADQTIPKCANRGSVPLSFAQQRLWFLDQYDPNSSVYNVPSGLRLRGPLEVVALERSLNEVVRRHEALRTTFSMVGDEPVQVIAPFLAISLPVEDLTSCPEEEREEKARQLVREEARRPFALSVGPVFRSKLWRLGDEDHILLLTMHHIVSDGWSMGVLQRELSVLYRAFVHGQPCPLVDLPIQYADYAVWQRRWLQGEVFQRQLSYWKKQLEGLPVVLNLPTDRPRPAVQSFRGARQSLELSKELTDGLKALSRKEGVTLFMTLLAAFQTLLYRYTGQQDIVVGSPIANRNRSEVEGLIGFFVNTLVLRSNLCGNPSFRELLGRVGKTALEAYEHQDLPFEKLVEELHPERSLSYSPLFQVMFVLRNAPGTGLEFEGLSVSPLRVGAETAKFDLTLSMYEPVEGLSGSLQYNTDLFDDATITRLLGHFQTLLKSIVREPEQRLSDLSILTDAEKHQLLIEWNDTRTDYPKDKCIHELFEAQVERSPDAIAVVFEDQELTYRELNRRANRLAHYLRRLGVGPESLVAICMERSIDMIVGLLGILKAGGAYVPLDPSYPRERLAFMLEDSQAAVLLTQDRLTEKLPAHGAQLVCLDKERKKVALEDGENPSSATTADNLAYVIYTSGSTGQPKGVAIKHAGSVAFLSWVSTVFTATEMNGVLASTSICFDLSVFEIFAPLSYGGRMVLVQNALSLASLSAASEVTLINTVPSALNELLPVRAIPPSVCTINLAGEPLKSTLVQEIYARTSTSKVYDLYGPSEDTTYSTFALRTADGPQTIGKPVANTQIYVLDAHLQPAPIGVSGELCIGGDGLARGYLNRPELTAEKFIPNPFSDYPNSRLYRTGDLARYLPDGSIEFLGRIDNQVKVRGFRIELGEIEAVLGGHPAVREVVVLAGEDCPGERRLVAYVVPAVGPVPSTNELRSFLQRKLPNYMIPSTFVTLDRLPLTASGKVDRQALPEPNGIKPELKEALAPPRNRTEEKLAGIWVELLGVKQVGIYDSFFDLGGHSLLAVRLFAEIEREFRKRLPLSRLFEEATIEHLADLIDRGDLPASRYGVVTIQSQGTKPPFFCVHELFGDVLCYLNLAHHLGHEQPFYALRARGLNGSEEPLNDIRAMAAYYIEQVRTVQPHGPYALGGLCSGGVVAFEMAQQLLAKGEPVSLLALLDSGVRRAQNTRRGFLINSLKDLPSWLIGSLQLNRSQWLTLMKMKVRLAKARLRSSERDAAPRFIEELGDLFQFSEQHLKVARAQYRALKQYRPRVYPGRIILFRARMQPFFSAHRPDKGWGPLAAGGLDIRVVPGNHLGMLQEPHVQVLAKHLRACLDRAQTKLVAANVRPSV